MRPAAPAEHVLRLKNTEEERALLGQEDRILRLLRRFLGVRVHARRGVVTVSGERHEVERAVDVLEQAVQRIRGGQQVTAMEIESQLRRLRDEGESEVSPLDRILRARDDTAIRPRTPNQATYVNGVQERDIVFAIGPAGTGKTYLAVAMAIRMMRRGRFRKLVLVRPAVEAGEHLGFLPGDLTAKVNPYLRPLYDALADFLEFDEVRRFQDNDVIEVVPLAYMRGRTLDNAFIILDEGQNTTAAQMKMFLTRMGRSSKIVVTGDITQTDLPSGKRSGLVDAQERLSRVDGIAFCFLGREDIVRHPLVQKIVDAYDSDGRPGRPHVVSSGGEAGAASGPDENV